MGSLFTKTKKQRIEKTAHFIYGIWDDGEIPGKFMNNIHKWNKYNWNTVIWNKASCNSLLNKYPNWKSLIEKCTRPIQMADLFRLLIVYDRGGFYFDLDVEPIEELPEIILEYEVVFFIEMVMSKEWAEETKKRFKIRNGYAESTHRVANFAFGSTPRHKAISDILELARKRLNDSTIYIDYDVLYTTGPDVVTEIVNSSKYENSLVMDAKWSSKYFKHHCTGTWRQGKDSPKLQLDRV
jgi:mannosyltransferase OCH1-like enzyme